MTDPKPLDPVERELVLADIAYLKQKEIDSGDRAKWEKTQPGFTLERVIREERERRQKIVR